MMSTSRSLTSGGNIVLSFALGIGLTVCSSRVCFGLIVVGVCFWCLAGGITLRARLLILILSSKITDSDVGGFFLESDSWTLLNVGFLLKSGKEEYAFTVVSSKICRFLTLITLFCSSMWTL